jgi:hypothetical protein
LPSFRFGVSCHASADKKSASALEYAKTIFPFL